MATWAQARAKRRQYIWPADPCEYNRPRTRFDVEAAAETSAGRASVLRPATAAGDRAEAATARRAATLRMDEDMTAGTGMRRKGGRYVFSCFAIGERRDSNFWTPPVCAAGWPRRQGATMLFRLPSSDREKQSGKLKNSSRLHATVHSVSVTGRTRHSCS